MKFAGAVLAALLLVITSLLPGGARADDLIRKHATHDVATTLDRLAAALTARGLNVGARIDHAGAAAAKNIELAPSQVLMFGDPKLGAPMMQVSPTIAIDLPLRALAWRDADGEVWLGYTDPAVLAARHGIAADHPSIAAMAELLDSVTTEAVRMEGAEAPPTNAVQVFPGLAYVVLKDSKKTGPRPNRTRLVRARIDAWRADGTRVYDSTLDGLSVENLRDMREQMMLLAKAYESTPVGGKRRWWLGAKQIPESNPWFEKADHMIDIEIVDVVDALPAPKDVKRMPEGVTLTEGGVGVLMLREGQGPHPTLEDTITVHYAGWQTDGKMFDASYLRDAPATFPLGKLIQGWQEALPLLAVGGKARIWIPGDLAYDQRADRPFAPKGMLVFEVELLGIGGE